MSTRPHELGGRGIRPQPGQVAALAHVPALTCALVTGGWFHPKSKTCPKNAGAASRVEVSSFRPALTDVISAEWKKKWDSNHSWLCSYWDKEKSVCDQETPLFPSFCGSRDCHLPVQVNPGAITLWFHRELPA